MKGKTVVTACVALLMAGAWTVEARGQDKNDAAMQKMVERGKLLVTIGGCNDCHSPKIMTPKGPVIDESRPLSGAPSENVVPAIPEGVLGPGKWGVLGSPDLTTWVGPWGVSFSRNLTPDVATGLGSWTEAMFVKALKTGKDMGEGRPILPPMPWDQIGQLPESELKAIFAYLRTLKPIKNAIHDPIPPPAPPAPPAPGK